MHPRRRARRPAPGRAAAARGGRAPGCAPAPPTICREGAVLGRGDQARHPARGRVRVRRGTRGWSPQGDVVVLEDLGSTNGTYLNGEPLRGPAAPARGRPHPHRRLRVHLRAMTNATALMLRVAEHWYGSDVGRQRQGNEDNYFVRSPLFVVADGMGGAQAGEVASEMAVEASTAGCPTARRAEGLVEIIQKANRRIHERSRSDAARGHGHDLHGGLRRRATRSSLAHVGDSRAYLLRDGELTRLTHDHSLVGELVARGKLTEEQAEAHPQRSVITRALGPEADVAGRHRDASRRATATSSCCARTA